MEEDKKNRVDKREKKRWKSKTREQTGEKWKRTEMK